MKRSALILQMLDVNHIDKENENVSLLDNNMPSSPLFIENTPPSLLNKQPQKNKVAKQRESSQVGVNSILTEDPQLINASEIIRSPRNVSSSSSSSSRSSSSSSSSSSSFSPTVNDASLPGPTRTKSVNYRQSPIHSNESDIDLSDSDPTFRIANPTTLPSRRNNISTSSSFSDSAKEDTTTEIKNTRKRKRKPQEWKQNKAKSLRNCGKSYVSLSKSRKVIPDRKVKLSCTSKCRLKCSENITENDRAELFSHYWGLSNLDLKRSYIKSCLLDVNPKYKYTNAARPRRPNSAFFFTIGNNRIRVCKLFFIRTLDITDRQIRTVKEKSDTHGFVDSEQRGKHGNNKKVNPELLQNIKNHINTIPRIESHYLRASTSKEYISEAKTIKDLWSDFDKLQREKDLPTCDYWLYLNTFNTEFNIGFYQPKKDRCETCVAYELAPEATKLLLKPNYDKHLIEKELCRQEKREDRRNIDENHICAVFDLQSVMLCPSPSYFYYSSKINCLDFTITELENSEDANKTAYGDVYCYFWDETQGQRGANEIGSCIFDYLRNLSHKNSDKKLLVTFYSDNCTGQNKNKAITSMYSYAVKFLPNIESITHKYLIKGHTQNEADNVHSLIEKEIKKNEKAGPIYTPAQYATLIKSAKKNGKPFTVKEVAFNFFFDFKQLQEEWGYNYNENTDKMTIVWKDIKVLKFVKGDNFQFHYKLSYTDEAFSTINMRCKRKKMLPFEDISLKCLYNEALKLKENKKKDLNDLVQKQLIPPYYTSFYNSL